MRRVIFTPAAKRDRRHFRAWFRQPGAGKAAHARLTSLEASIANLAIFPLVNRAGPVAGTRLLVSQGHRVTYRLLPDAVHVLEAGDVLILRIHGPGQAG